jgi:signal transduction histidine kinase/ligand-binding sensor protein
MESNATGSFWDVIEQTTLRNLIQLPLGQQRPWAVFPIGKNEYISEHRAKFCRFCSLVRSTAEGEKRCRKCDAKAASRISKTGKADVYICHAGLWDIAVPVFTPDRHFIAAFFTGQLRCSDVAKDKLALPKVKHTEKSLGLRPNSLMSIRDTLEEQSLSKMKTFASQTLLTIADYLGAEWQAKIDSSLHIREHDAADQIRTRLQGCANPRQYFQELPAALQETSKALRADRTWILFPPGPGRPLSLIPRAVYDPATPQPKLPQDQFSLHDPLLRRLPLDEVTSVPATTRSQLLNAFSGFHPRGNVLATAVSVGEKAPLLLLSSAPQEDWRLKPTCRALLTIARELVTSFIRCREFANKADFARAMSHEMIGPSRAIHSIGAFLADALSGEIHISADKLRNRLQDVGGLSDLLMTRAIAFQKAADLAEAKIGNIVLLPMRDPKPRETSRLRVKQATDDFVGLLMECVRIYQAILRENKDEGEFDVNTPSLWQLGSLAADLSLLKHILMNLLDNAVKYRKKDSNVHIYGRLHGDIKGFYVEEEGLQFEDLDRACELYFRGEQARQYCPSGTGIGLSLVKRFCELHHWDLCITQEPRSNKMTRVTVGIEVGPDAVRPVLQAKGGTT